MEQFRDDTFVVQNGEQRVVSGFQPFEVLGEGLPFGVLVGRCKHLCTQPHAPVVHHFAFGLVENPNMFLLQGCFCNNLNPFLEAMMFENEQAEQ